MYMDWERLLALQYQIPLLLGHTSIYSSSKLQHRQSAAFCSQLVFHIKNLSLFLGIRDLRAPNLFRFQSYTFIEPILSLNLFFNLNGNRTIVASVVVSIATKSSIRLPVWIHGDDVAGVDQSGDKAKNAETNVDGQVHGETSLDGHWDRRDKNCKQHQKPIAGMHFINRSFAQKNIGGGRSLYMAR